MDYKTTDLWKSLVDGGAEAARLVTSYESFRENARQLTSLIQKSLPSLTVHDVTHLDGLWQTGSLLAGSTLKLNPLEIFIYGGAVLLHDSALCFEAYGGVDTLRATDIWRDAYALGKERGELVEKVLTDFCDFQSVRLLHAKQAAFLATKTWRSKETEEHISLISDDLLRNSYGEIIGQIASTHHWNIDELKERLPPFIGATDEFPNEWGVNPIKIACLLRCADALHISKARAPDLLNIITTRAGVSRNHWQAQNWLAPATLHPDDTAGQTLLITSTKAFDEKNDRAWWVAYDLIELANREIQAANEVLRGVSGATDGLQIKQIAGSGSTSELSKYVRTSGWRPAPIKLGVSDVKGLVEKLGGQSLYGTKDFESNFLIVLRELIQNAKDAINARTELDPEATRKILITLTETNDSYSFSICDSGCGMSRGVLTGPFLDFGNSFWTSDLVNLEFPKLKGMGFRSSGKYGIGFYSCFMVANSVCVLSRNYKDSIDKSIMIEFNDGVSLRPKLIENIDTKTTTYVTEIVLTIDKSIVKNGFIFRFGTKTTTSSVLDIPLSDTIAYIARYAGICIEYQNNNERKIELVNGDQIHEPLPTELEIDFVTRSEGVSPTTQQIEIVSKNIRPIVPENPEFGMAALYPFVGTNEGFGSRTVGGLRSNLNSGSVDFIGFIDHHPDSAKRNPGEQRATDQELRTWCENQLHLLEKIELSDVDRHFLGLRIANFKLDPTPYLRIPMYLDKDTFVFFTIADIVNLLLNTHIYLIQTSKINMLAGEADARKFDLYPRISNRFGAMRIIKNSVEDHDASSIVGLENDYSVLGCISHSLNEQGFDLRLETKDSPHVATLYGFPLQSVQLSANPKKENGSTQ